MMPLVGIASAKVIGGDKDELQIISAARVFIDRQEVLERILNDLFHLFRTEEGKYVSHCLRLILCAMEVCKLTTNNFNAL